MKNWYVVQSKPNKEQFLYEQLRIGGIEAFFPSIRVEPANPRCRKIRPYFPGYLFVLANLAGAERPILQRLPGAIGIVMFGGEPADVSEHLVETLRHHLEVVNAAGKKSSQLFRTGDAVTIQQGPFYGYEAIFDAALPGQRRVQVLLSLIQGRRMKVELPMDYISARNMKIP